MSIFDEIAKSDIAAIQKLVSENPAVLQEVNQNGNTPFIYATRVIPLQKVHLQLIDNLLELLFQQPNKEALINATSKSPSRTGTTALHCMIANRPREEEEIKMWQNLLEKMIKNGSNVNAAVTVKNSAYYGITPFLLAASKLHIGKQYIEIVKLMLETTSCDLNVTVSTHCPRDAGKTALWYMIVNLRQLKTQNPLNMPTINAVQGLIKYMISAEKKADINAMSLAGPDQGKSCFSLLASFYAPDILTTLAKSQQVDFQVRGNLVIALSPCILENLCLTYAKHVDLISSLLLIAKALPDDFNTLKIGPHSGPTANQASKTLDTCRKQLASFRELVIWASCISLDQSKHSSRTSGMKIIEDKNGVFSHIMSFLPGESFLKTHFNPKENKSPLESKEISWSDITQRKKTHFMERMVEINMKEWLTVAVRRFITSYQGDAQPGLYEETTQKQKLIHDTFFKNISRLQLNATALAILCKKASELAKFKLLINPANLNTVLEETLKLQPHLDAWAEKILIAFEMGMKSHPLQQSYIDKGRATLHHYIVKLLLTHPHYATLNPGTHHIIRYTEKLLSEVNRYIFSSEMQRILLRLSSDGSFRIFRISPRLEHFTLFLTLTENNSLATDVREKRAMEEKDASVTHKSQKIEKNVSANVSHHKKVSRISLFTKRTHNPTVIDELTASVFGRGQTISRISSLNDHYVS